MKVLWVGDAVVPSGFAKCTHIVCDRLHELGHEVAVLGINYFGDPHRYPYPIYPCRHPFEGGHDGFGVGRLPTLCDQLKPDVIVLLNDPWNVPGYMDTLSAYYGTDIPVPVVGWIAVDAKNQRGSALNSLSHVATWTQFAVDELQVGGCTAPLSIVPLGVDNRLYTPRDKSQSRRVILGDDIASRVGDLFIVGAVGRNQLRKRLDLTIESFAEFAHNGATDALLFLHVGPTGDNGVNIASLVRYYGLTGRVIESTAPIGVGLDESALPALYSALDIYVTTTQGEGWGLPCLEAMACGVPCVVPDYSGLGDWARDAALFVECSTTVPTAPLNSQAYTLGAIPSAADIASALADVYCYREVRDDLRRRGLATAERLQWSKAADAMVELLTAVVSGD